MKMTRIAPPTTLATSASLPRAQPLRRFLFPAAMLVLLAGCGSLQKAPAPPLAAAPAGNQANLSGPNNGARLPLLPPAGSGRGGYYQDDGPGDKPPDGLLDLPDVIPKIEPYSLTGNKPYAVFGKTYTPLVDPHPFKQRGIGSWYGKKFHGHKTSSGEPYDMYKLTAAHPTLPIPSYARVTNLRNGVQIIVRINDRGPFHSSRIIDLSYAAALKLGYLGNGSSELEVERLLPEDIAQIAAANQQGKVSAQIVVVPAAVTPSPIVSSSLPDVPAAPADSQSTPDEITLIAAMSSVTAPLATLVNPDAGGVSATSTASNGNVVSSGYWDVQLGAFTEIGNAEAVRARLMQTWDSSLPPLEVTFVGIFYRLHSGPFSTRAEAALAVQKVRTTSEIKPLIVQR